MKKAISDLMMKMRAAKKEGWEYLEVKQLAEILARQRAKLRLAVQEYRAHKKAHMAERDTVEKLYLGYEGMFMRDHLRDAIRLYVLVNHDFHEAYRMYMHALKTPKTVSAKPIVMVDAPKAPQGRKAA